jgi:hypothetical protein
LVFHRAGLTLRQSNTVRIREVKISEEAGSISVYIKWGNFRFPGFPPSMRLGSQSPLNYDVILDEFGQVYQVNAGKACPVFQIRMQMFDIKRICFSVHHQNQRDFVR